MMIMVIIIIIVIIMIMIIFIDYNNYGYIFLCNNDIFILLNFHIIDSMLIIIYDNNDIFT